jgi:acetylornithine deacetylase
MLPDRDLLARLVAFDTTSHFSNLPLAEFLAEYLDRPGVRVQQLPNEKGDKANLLIAAGPEPHDGSGLVLSGHMDVVPADEPDWRSDPFALTESGDTLVARGAADMKGFLAVAANRFAATDAQRLKAPLMLLFTHDEETGTHGARRFSETWTDRSALPRSVVIGEPTSLRVVRAHKGMMRLRLAFEGKAAHSGYPHLGRSAIEPAAEVIVALAALRRAMEAERPAHGEEFPEVPFAALNVGTVAGGSAANVIPDHCVVQLSVRLLPGMTLTEMTERIRHIVAGAAGRTPFTLEQVSLSPAMLLEEGAPIYRELAGAVGQRAPVSVMFATDAGWLQTMGLECVLFGPGNIEVAHKANEFVPVGELRRAGEVLDGLIRRRCAEP